LFQLPLSFFCQLPSCLRYTFPVAAGVVVDAKAGAVDFYRRYGFVSLEALQGTSAQRPEPVLMFLGLGSVPRRG
jgi:hypothetical protein